MENSVTVNGITYDFIAFDNPKNIILGSGQNCVKCDVNLRNEDDAYLFCKLCSAFDVIRFRITQKYRQEHYFKKRNK